MNEARIASVHELQFEAPIELARLWRQRALEIDYELIQQWFVRAAVKKTAEVLIILWTIRIERDAAVNPARNFETRLWRFCFRQHVRFPSEHKTRAQTHDREEDEPCCKHCIGAHGEGP